MKSVNYLMKSIEHDTFYKKSMRFVKNCAMNEKNGNLILHITKHYELYKIDSQD